MWRDYEIKHYEGNSFILKKDPIAEESQFTLFVNKKELVTFLCSPSDYVNLGIGYLVSEGIIKTKKDILHIDLQELEHYVNITLDPIISVNDWAGSSKILTTGCGKGSILFNSILDCQLAKNETQVTLSAQSIISLMREFQRKSELFQKTGGVHSVGLCSKSEILFHIEDIGRHNAVDKIIGMCFLQDIETKDKILLLSGRIAVEMVQKAARAGISILVSKSAPTTMAIDLANKIGMSLVGFVRGERMNIYSHPLRIISS